MSPPMVLCWESQAGGVRVGGQLCNRIMTRRWGHCVGCAKPWMLSLRYSAPSRGPSWQLAFLSPCEDYRHHHGSCGQQRIIDRLWTGEMKCIGPKANDADLWLLIWEVVRRIPSRRNIASSRACQGAWLKEGDAGNVALRPFCHGRPWEG